MVIVVTEAQGRALFSLFLLQDRQLLRCPATSLADELGIDVSVAYRHIAALKKQGLIESHGRFGIRIIVPELGWIYHRHEDDQCTSRIPVRGINEPGRGCCCYEVGQVSLKNALKRIKGSIEVRERRRGRRTISRRTANILLSFYSKLRRQRSSSYMSTGGDEAKAVKVVRVLASRMVGPDLFERYVQHAFEVFPRVVKREDVPPFPPVAFLASETIVDGFVAELGPRRLNVEKAKKLLSEKGFIDVDVEIAASIARNCRDLELLVPPGLGRLGEAVTFILNHYVEIGYRSDV